MRFLLDESAELRLLSFFQAAGHYATAIVVHHRQALDDAVVLRIARDEALILVTNDTDFGDLVYRQACNTPESSCFGWRMRRWRKRWGRCISSSPLVKRWQASS